MADFNFPIDYGVQAEFRPRVNTVPFGDGYKQRLPDGLNTDLPVWSVSMRTRTNTETDNILAFLRARKGSESFTWSTCPDGGTKNYICQSWQRIRVSYNNNDIFATFEEVVV